MEGQHYEHVYDVMILDDLHNYFPELLYNPLRFETVPQVLSYVHSQIAARFNLFQYGRRRYYHARNTQAAAAAAAATTEYYQHPSGFRTTAAPIPGNQQQERHQQHPFTQVYQSRNDLPLDRLLSLFGLGSGVGSLFTTGGMGLYEDVLVRPTDRQIESASRLLLGSDLTASQVGGGAAGGGSAESNQPPFCSICQDSIQREDPCRLLQTCGHSFHQVCIDEWFHRNVRCPVCRADIRSSSSNSREEETTLPVTPLAARRGRMWNSSTTTPTNRPSERE